VKKTQQAIRHALTERYYAWQDAHKIARTRSDIDLTGRGPAYQPEVFDEDISVAEEIPTEPEKLEAVAETPIKL
jgi:large subunit ribosomal protein L47